MINLAINVMLALPLLMSSHDLVAEAEACIEIHPPPIACSLNQLNNGVVADADDVMENFNTLGDAIDTKPPSVCANGQMTQSSEGEWICADMPSSSPYTWQYKGQISQHSTQIENGALYLVTIDGYSSLQFSARNSRNELVVAPFYLMENLSNCWVSLASSTGGLLELKLLAVTEITVDTATTKSSWDFIKTSDSPGSLANLTPDAVYRLEVIGCP